MKTAIKFLVFMFVLLMGVSTWAGRKESTGTLTIDSDPSGAEVFINTELKGTTPVKIANVPSGDVHVSLVKEHFDRHNQVVKLVGGEEKNLGRIKLGEEFGKISIKTTPPHAMLRVDERLLDGTTPLSVSRLDRHKVYHLKVTLSGYRAWTMDVDLSQEAVKVYDIVLKKE